MPILPICKALMCLGLASFALLVGYDNIADYRANYVFVQHVLSMDTVFPQNTLKDRAISSPMLWQVGYAGIIAGELLTGILLLIGGGKMLVARRQPEKFVITKNWIYLGGTLGFLLWFLGFMVIGGEWFSMWQSSQWNGIEAAFRFNMMILGVMIFVAQPETDMTNTVSD